MRGKFSILGLLPNVVILDEMERETPVKIEPRVVMPAPVIEAPIEDRRRTKKARHPVDQGRRKKRL